MKETDYAPRAAYFDTLLTGKWMIVAEIGVSAGAHAQALLQYCPVSKLYLIDPWHEADRFTEGYCHGRLKALGLWHRVEFIAKESLQAVEMFPDGLFDALYFDQLHDYKTVTSDLVNWWPKLSRGGIIGYRNYNVPDISRAVDMFCASKGIKAEIVQGEAIIRK